MGQQNEAKKWFVNEGEQSGAARSGAGGRNRACVADNTQSSLKQNKVPKQTKPHSYAAFMQHL